MLAVAGIALAIPMTMMILGIKGFCAKPAGPAPEVPGLRAALELAASRTLPAPAELGAGRRHYVLMPAQEIRPPAAPSRLPASASPDERRKKIERSAGELGGSTLLLGQPSGGARLLVQIPAAASVSFEKLALAGLSSSGSPDPAADTTWLYEILLPPP